MHRVSIGLHASKKKCVNILSNIVLIVLLFQENKSFGASYHLHSSSDVREAVSGTVRTHQRPFLIFSFFDNPPSNRQNLQRVGEGLDWNPGQPHYSQMRYY